MKNRRFLLYLFGFIEKRSEHLKIGIASVLHRYYVGATVRWNRVRATVSSLVPQGVQYLVVERLALLRAEETADFNFAVITTQCKVVLDRAVLA